MIILNSAQRAAPSYFRLDAALAESDLRKKITGCPLRREWTRLASESSCYNSLFSVA
jgi:hypothetical protein